MRVPQCNPKKGLKDVCPARSIKGKDAYDSRAQSGMQVCYLIDFRELDGPTTNTKDKTWTIRTSMQYNYNYNTLNLIVAKSLILMD